MPAPRAGRNPHGGLCECELLAAALRCEPAAISFDFCRRVLQRHWQMTCRHGCSEQPAPPSVAQRWTPPGPADTVQAILIGNAPQG